MKSLKSSQQTDTAKTLRLIISFAGSALIAICYLGIIIHACLDKRVNAKSQPRDGLTDRSVVGKLTILCGRTVLRPKSSEVVRLMWMLKPRKERKLKHLVLESVVEGEADLSARESVVIYHAVTADGAGVASPPQEASAPEEAPASSPQDAPGASPSLEAAAPPPSPQPPAPPVAI